MKKKLLTTRRGVVTVAPLHPHTVFVVPTDLHLRDPQSGYESEESILLGIHAGTGLIAGFQLADTGADPGRVLWCVMNCMLPKEALLRREDVPGEWAVCGNFPVFNVPADIVGDMETVLIKLCRNHGIRLDIRADNDAVPQVVLTTAVTFARRMEEAFCLDARELSHMPQRFPSVWSRAALHGFSYRPGRGFVERLCTPPEWEQYLADHPLQPLDEYRQERVKEDFDAAAHVCVGLGRLRLTSGFALR